MNRFNLNEHDVMDVVPDVINTGSDNRDHPLIDMMSSEPLDSKKAVDVSAISHAMLGVNDVLDNMFTRFTIHVRQPVGYLRWVNQQIPQLQRSVKRQVNNFIFSIQETDRDFQGTGPRYLTELQLQTHTIDFDTLEYFEFTMSRLDILNTDLDNLFSDSMDIQLDIKDRQLFIKQRTSAVIKRDLILVKKLVNDARESIILDNLTPIGMQLTPMVQYNTKTIYNDVERITDNFVPDLGSIVNFVEQTGTLIIYIITFKQLLQLASTLDPPYANGIPIVFQDNLRYSPDDMATISNAFMTTYPSIIGVLLLYVELLAFRVWNEWVVTSLSSKSQIRGRTQYVRTMVKDLFLSHMLHGLDTAQEYVHKKLVFGMK